jgi:hypothetical protein
MKVQTITQHQFTYLGTQRSWIGNNVRVVRERMCPTSSPRTADKNERCLRSISLSSNWGVTLPRAQDEQPKQLEPEPEPLSEPQRLNLSLSLCLSLSLVHSCNCIKNKYTIKKQISSFLQFLKCVNEVNSFSSFSKQTKVILTISTITKTDKLVLYNI